MVNTCINIKTAIIYRSLVSGVVMQLSRPGSALYRNKYFGEVLTKKKSSSFENCPKFKKKTNLILTPLQNYI